MVRCRDHDRVDILAGKNLAEIPGRETILVLIVLVHRSPWQRIRWLLSTSQTATTLGILVIEVGREVPVHAMAAGADEADRDAVARGRLAISTTRGGWDDRRRGDRRSRGGGLLEERAAGLPGLGGGGIGVVLFYFHEATSFND